MLLLLGRQPTARETTATTTSTCSSTKPPSRALCRCPRRGRREKLEGELVVVVPLQALLLRRRQSRGDRGCLRIQVSLGESWRERKLEESNERASESLSKEQKK